MQAASVLGVSGPQLRHLRDEGGLPQGAWRNVTRHKRRFTEYDPAVIDKLAVTNTGETPDMTDADNGAGTDVPVADIELSPVAIEALATVAKLGPFSDDSGRSTRQLQDAMPTGPGYATPSISSGCKALEDAGLIRRNTNGKRTYEIKVTARGRKWLQAHREYVPHVPDTGHGLAAPPAEAITVRNVDSNGQVQEHTLVAEPPPGTVLTPEAQAAAAVGAQLHGEAPPEPEPAAEPEPAPAAPEPAPVATEDAPVAPEPAPAGLEALPLPPQALGVAGGAQGVPEVPPSAIASALLHQVVRVLSDSSVAALTAERDALAAHNASLSGHVAQLRQRAADAEAEAREAKAVLHQVEAQLTPLLTGRDPRAEGWLDAATRTELLQLITEVAQWA